MSFLAFFFPSQLLPREDFSPSLLAQHRSSAASGILKFTNPVRSWGQRWEDLSWLSEPQRNGAILPIRWWSELGEGSGAASVPLVLCLQGLLGTLIFHTFNRQKGSLSTGHFSWPPLCHYFQSIGCSETTSLSLCSSMRKSRQFFPFPFSPCPSLPQIACKALLVLLVSSTRD